MGSSEVKRAQRAQAHSNTLPVPSRSNNDHWQVTTQVTEDSWNAARARGEIHTPHWAEIHRNEDINGRGVSIIPHSPAEVQAPEQHLATCDFCRSNIAGDRYKCINCPDFDTCSSCFSLTDSQHVPNHRFVRIQKADDYITVKGSPASTPVPTHEGIQCDACHHIIRGIRHKCRQCADYDLCTPCIASGYLDAHVVRNPNHEFFNITQPRAATAPTQGLVGSNLPAIGARNAIPTWHSKPATLNSPEELLFPVSQAPEIHLANCDLCKSTIVGDRYKCVNCPDFDTCSSCFPNTVTQHPGHRFVRISKANDYIHVGFAPLPSQLPEHAAYCNACGQTIRGNRFKCTHPFCPDYDLCQNCEALPGPLHPANHPLLKIKTPPAPFPASANNTNFSGFFPNTNPTQKIHEQKVNIADNLDIAGSLLNIGMTLFS